MHNFEEFFKKKFFFLPNFSFCSLSSRLYLFKHMIQHKIFTYIKKKFSSEMSLEIKISKYLSSNRHGAKEYLTISDDGFVSVESLINLKSNYCLSLEGIKKIVENNDKKRFELKQEDGKYFIRAVQGHSIKGLSDEKMMKEISDFREFETVVHGTYLKNWLSIKVEGLKIMNRNHIHFSPGYPEDGAVISGMRSSCEIFIELNLRKALESGIKFYLSSNRVILSPGISGMIHSKFFKCVRNRKREKFQ